MEILNLCLVEVKQHEKTSLLWTNFLQIKEERKHRTEPSILKSTKPLTYRKPWSKFDEEYEKAKMRKETGRTDHERSRAD